MKKELTKLAFAAVVFLIYVGLFTIYLTVGANRGPYYVIAAGALVFIGCILSFAVIYAEEI